MGGPAAIIPFEAVNAAFWCRQQALRTGYKPAGSKGVAYASEMDCAFRQIQGAIIVAEELLHP